MALFVLPPTLPSASPVFAVRRKALYVLALVVAIFLIGDASFNVFSALKRHEPSYRIFRSLLELNLVLWGAVVSLALWKSTIGTAAIQTLFFAPLLGRGERRLYHSHPSDLEDEDDNDNDNKVTASPKGPKNQDGDGEDLAAAEENDLLDQGLGEAAPPPPPSPTTQVVSAWQVADLALDMLLPILIMLFLFTLSSSRRQQQQATGDAGDEPPPSEAIDISDDDDQDENAFWSLYSRIAAPTFPLLLFGYLLFRAFVPWRGRRASFWIVVSYTLGAPWFPVAFRDGFIGDVFTSTVRPLKDVCFTLFYILFGLKGWWSTQEYRDWNHSNFVGTADANVPAMERSWIVHTVVLPVCTASPLWWRFLQNLRQVYDERQRWPYLGNALKYFVAAQVAMFGVFHPNSDHNVLFLVCFVLATLYQIWWDVVMDWELLNVQTGRLRSRRLYQSKAFYWTICWINVVLRFGWTWSFLPFHYLNQAGVLTESFSSNWVRHLLGPTLASAEIVRRTLWGFLRFEWEAVKTNLGADDEGKIYMEDVSSEGDDDDNNKGEGTRSILELTPMSVKQSGGNGTTTSAGSDNDAMPPPTKLSFFGDMAKMNPIQVILELGLYATTFCLFCFVLAAHRGTF